MDAFIYSHPSNSHAMFRSSNSRMKSGNTHMGGEFGDTDGGLRMPSVFRSDAYADAL